MQGQRAKKGIFVTTTRFSEEAIRYASSIDTKVILIDGNKLARFMVEHDIGVLTSRKSGFYFSIGGNLETALFDTGSLVNVIDPATADKIGIEKYPQTKPLDLDILGPFG